ncbi:sulfite oxidase [Entomortierella parvispora]|uniref:Sulfite oxidase n=1 Tax=Entomortierella parvispora TaxID=205924 RepID=A0A9P3LSE4_9FUNG|nr:sulfite oxidase [Entomortierella parvispora]
MSWGTVHDEAGLFVPQYFSNMIPIANASKAVELVFDANRTAEILSNPMFQPDISVSDAMARNSNTYSFRFNRGRDTLLVGASYCSASTGRVCHSADIQPVFASGAAVPGFGQTGDDARFVHQVEDRFTTFAKTGPSLVHPPSHERVHESQLDYSHDPTRDLPSFIVHAQTPFNAEPRLPLLVNAGQITPTDIFFKRNHGPIPDIRLESHKVYIGLQHPDSSPRLDWAELSMYDIMSRWPKVTVTASLQCAGNRRDGLAALKEVKGVIWGAGTISNATWSGVRLADVLRDIAGIPTDLSHDMVRDFHVSFEADDQVHEDACYGSSIPLRKAMDPVGDVILAYEMNGKPLTRDHGFPLRAIVPGYIGARSVKFLQKIIVQPEESLAFYQRRDYKILPPWVNSSNVESSWDSAASLNEMNVQCVICTPLENEMISSSAPVTIKGYAIAGGGKGIYRVEISIDGGSTWEPVDRMEQHPDRKSGMFWAWALWEKSVPRIRPSSEIIARAYDSSGNMQPETPIWNHRGVMNNAWFRVKNVTQLPQHNL